MNDHISQLLHALDSDEIQDWEEFEVHPSRTLLEEAVDLFVAEAPEADVAPEKRGAINHFFECKSCYIDFQAELRERNTATVAAQTAELRAYAQDAAVLSRIAATEASPEWLREL